MAGRKLLIVATHGKDDQERATIPFVMANAALAEGSGATIVLQAEGVWLAIRDYALGIHADSFPPLQDLMTAFLGQGGVLMACTPCLKARKIPDEQLMPGVRLVAAATVVAESASAHIAFTY